MSSQRAFLSQIVDYAGLFPPAGLPLDVVIRNFRDYSAGPNSWMLARLIVPASRLEELQADPVFTDRNEIWRISCLVPGPEENPSDFQASIEKIDDFNEENNQIARIDVIETKIESTEIIENVARILPDHLTAFLEIDATDQSEKLIHGIAESARQNLMAKIRTGGVTTNLFSNVFGRRPLYFSLCNIESWFQSNSWTSSPDSWVVPADLRIKCCARHHVRVRQRIRGRVLRLYRLVTTRLANPDSGGG